MVMLKCKMCGGDLHPVENATTCECAYCETLQTIPVIDNEKKASLYGRAQRLLFGCEFDKAAGVFETIVAEFPTEAEAYWGLVLCKYGIEYVDDPVTKKKIPTCHRSGFESVLDNQNYEQALENTDAVARRVYREEARVLESLREKIVEISNSADSYDVFISYKETDEKGDRTEDSVLAQDIYSALKEKGYKVFFSRISLEDKLGEEYEPYIFAAINSAKVMLVVGTDYEYMNAVWVKNEWSRYLELISKGNKKTLIPCYKDMDPHDLPKELLKLQAQDMGKIGAMQDLLRGVEKFLSTSESISKEDEEKRKKIENLRTIAKRAKDSDDLINATKYYEQLLVEDPNDWEAVFYPAYFNCLNHVSENIGPYIAGQLQQTFQLIADNITDDQKRKESCDEIVKRIDNLIVVRGTAMMQQEVLIQDRVQRMQVMVSHIADLDYVVLHFTTGLIKCNEYDSALKYLDSIKGLSDNIPPKHETQDIRDAKILIDASIDSIKKKQAEVDDEKRKEEEIKRKKEEEEKQKRRDAYWASHTDEKERLDKEKEELNKQLSEQEAEKQIILDKLNKEMDIASDDREENEICERINQLESELSSLGFFKRKEKKEIQDLIDQAENKRFEVHDQIIMRIEAVEKKIADAVFEPDQKIGKLKKRIAEIDFEFSKDR